LQQDVLDAIDQVHGSSLSLVSSGSAAAFPRGRVCAVAPVGRAASLGECGIGV
jgi:hypothetical protein